MPLPVIHLHRHQRNEARHRPGRPHQTGRNHSRDSGPGQEWPAVTGIRTNHRSMGPAGHGQTIRVGRTGRSVQRNHLTLHISQGVHGPIGGDDRCSGRGISGSGKALTSGFSLLEDEAGQTGPALSPNAPAGRTHCSGDVRTRPRHRWQSARRTRPGCWRTGP